MPSLKKIRPSSPLWNLILENLFLVDHKTKLLTKFFMQIRNFEVHNLPSIWLAELAQNRDFQWTMFNHLLTHLIWHVKLHLAKRWSCTQSCDLLRAKLLHFLTFTCLGFYPYATKSIESAWGNVMLTLGDIGYPWVTMQVTVIPLLC